ncbi:D-inositol 3-phosphate glycosyltransferase [Filimonas sp.]|nr:D-inositol 3-phosphate glycosyltransferase [Filimonas sp.]
MPRVIRIFNRLILGGPAFNVTYLTKFLEPDFETKLLIGTKDDHEQDADFLTAQYGITPVEIPNMKRAINWTDDRAAYLQIKKIIQEYKPHIVHTHAAKPGAIGRLAASACNVPVILHTFHGHVFHSYFGKMKTNFFIQAERYLAKKTDRIIAISEQQKEELTTQFNICAPEKMVVVPLGLDLEKFYTGQESKRTRFRKQFQIHDDEIAIGIIGRIVPIKNHALFIDAVKYLLERTQQKIRIIIVGDGDQRESLFEQLKTYHIPYNYFPEDPQPKTVTFTSWLTGMDDVFAGIDIVALSSLNEGTPVSLIEAQAANKPIVTTDVGGVRDVVLDNETAFITPSGDAAAFADALLRLTEDASLRIYMGEKGCHLVKDKFDKSRLVNDMRHLYYELLKEKNVTF